MKHIILALTLLSSLSVFASSDCISNKALDNKAVNTQFWLLLIDDDDRCKELNDMIQGNLCDDVKQETINYAEDVLDLMCD